MDYNSTTASFSSSSFLSLHPRLPPHCHPSNDFLYKVSAYTHTCVPIPLAFASTFVGTCSIAAWLFAQLPQIIKNFQLSSASGLSMFFLIEWLAGDASNFFGALLTGQATWQKIIGFYYCIADIVLLGQYLWYEHLRHGRPMRVLWVKRYMDGHIEPDPEPMIAAMDFAHQPLIRREHRVNSSDSMPPRRSGRRKITRQGNSFQATPPTKVVVALSLLLAVLSRASPLPSSTNPMMNNDHDTFAVTKGSDGLSHTIGVILSWSSTLLYLISRIPQLVKNQRRKSTAGLSIKMFVAAFLGNVFYSTSLLLNPCAWNSYGPHGGRGWVSGGGSNREQWVAAAAPFFLGAAGVLTMDACIFVQSLYFGDGGIRIEEPPSTAADFDAGEIPEDQLAQSRERLLVIESKDSFGQRKWRQVKGWMRGWNPSYSAANSVASGSPMKSSSRSRATSKTSSSRSRSQPRTPLHFRSPMGSMPNSSTPLQEQLKAEEGAVEQRHSESTSQADTEVASTTPTTSTTNTVRNVTAAATTTTTEEDEQQPLLSTPQNPAQQRTNASPSYRVLDQTGSVYHDAEDFEAHDASTSASSPSTARNYGTLSGGPSS